jgi:hypothetical protein
MRCTFCTRVSARHASDFAGSESDTFGSIFGRSREKADPAICRSESGSESVASTNTHTKCVLSYMLLIALYITEQLRKRSDIYVNRY